MFLNVHVKKTQISEQADLLFLSHTTPAYSFDEYLDLVKSFHGHVAPGLVMGGVMVDLALKELPQHILFDACCETYNCLPDAIQLLTPCTIGNGWLKLFDFGRFAISLFDKYQGDGVRISVDFQKLDCWNEIKSWFLKLKPKKDQDSERLLEEIRQAGHDLYQIDLVHMHSEQLIKRSLGKISICSVCKEPYPAKHGKICRSCQGDSPYLTAEQPVKDLYNYTQKLKKVPVNLSEGMKAIHDMTQIIPGKIKGPAIKRGQSITVGDICRLQQMGRQYIYEESCSEDFTDHIHENEVARTFADVMAGDGVIYDDEPHEGKIDFIAQRDGLLIVDKSRLESFNLVQGVMCATRKSYSIVQKDRKLGGTRAIPLYLPETEFLQAMTILDGQPLLKVLPLRKAKIGILVTGTEVFQGLINDQFIPIITAKTIKLGCTIIKSIIVPDERKDIQNSIDELIQSGADLIITTAGLSVDPDDVTRLGLEDAGATSILYGIPVLPGAMTLLANIGHVQIIGVPACALFFPTTSFDLLLPRLLAGIRITRKDLAQLGHGAFCWGCKKCTFPKCNFGKD
ncbi:MAG: trehalose-binding protein [Candidatus Magnetomorum sp.]|nr:trehalose-binding protein [Candidatus Magnetomorum sp.]